MDIDIVLELLKDMLLIMPLPLLGQLPLLLVVLALDLNPQYIGGGTTKNRGKG